ncbi:MAG TPA: hypothetical protein VFU81_01485, partial [Thermomicrobiales bacterium]|nr:hypothetical protein [Thermomicrobiales bacterium]
VAGERRLADARLAADEDQPTAAEADDGEFFAQEELLQRPADEEGRRARRKRSGVAGRMVHGRDDAVRDSSVVVISRARIVPIWRGASLHPHLVGAYGCD